jgi:hypothetical protein
MRIRKHFVIPLCFAIVFFMLACGDEVAIGTPTSSTARSTYTGEFELESNLDQTASNGALNYVLKGIVPLKIAWLAENSLWKITGTDAKAQGTVTLAGGAVNCTGNLTGSVEIVGYVYPEKLKPCMFKLSIFQNWSSATLVCTASFPFAYTQEIPNGSAAFSISDDFNYQAISGDHSKQVSYTNGMLTGILRIKMRSFSGGLIDGCAVTP